MFGGDYAEACVDLRNIVESKGKLYVVMKDCKVSQQTGGVSYYFHVVYINNNVPIRINRLLLNSGVITKYHGRDYSLVVRNPGVEINCFLSHKLQRDLLLDKLPTIEYI